ERRSGHQRRVPRFERRARRRRHGRRAGGGGTVHAPRARQGPGSLLHLGDPGGSRASPGGTPCPPRPSRATPAPCRAMERRRMTTDVVIPTVGRGSLALLLASLDGPPDRLPHRVIVVDDRPDPVTPLAWGDVSPELRERLDVFTSGGRGPAAARNRGWHASHA